MTDRPFFFPPRFSPHQPNHILSSSAITFNTKIPSPTPVNPAPPSSSDMFHAHMKRTRHPQRERATRQHEYNSQQRCRDARPPYIRHNPQKKKNQFCGLLESLRWKNDLGNAATKELPTLPPIGHVMNCTMPSARVMSPPPKSLCRRTHFHPSASLNSFAQGEITLQHAATSGRWSCYTAE